jgi:hypothetical protein
MELTRFDLKNQAIQERIAVALERIAETLEIALSPLALGRTVSPPLEQRKDRTEK